MVLMNGGIFPAEHRPRPVQKLLLSPAGPLLARLLGRDKFMAALAEVFGEKTRPGSEATDVLWSIAVGVNGRASLARRIHYMKDRVEHEARWVGALREATIPMLMINGVDDPISGGHVCDVLEQDVPQIRIARLEGIGHFPPLEAPGDCVRLILDFHGFDPS
jgi:pimeloyl-ACP methyl ester carboxylesterase